MAVTPKDEDDLIKSQKASAKQFSEAAKELRNAAKGVQKNSLRQELGLTKAGIRESLEDKLLGTGFKRVIYNFILDKKRERQLRKSTKLTQSEFKAFSKKTKQDKTDVNVANAQKKAQDARNQALKDQLGEEEANKIIESENAENHAEIIERDQILAESEKEQQDLEAAQRAEQSAADDEESKSKGEGSLDTMFGDVVSGLELVAGELEKLSGLGGGGGGGGKTGAEADKAAAEASAQSQRQTNALEKIAENLTGGGMGGKGADGGESSGDGGGGMLGKLGAGLGALGKGIGVLLKFAGKGLMIFLKMFAKGIMSFANPLVIGGLAVFTLGMIGLGAALRLAAPAIEAFAPVLIKIADVIGNVLMTAIKEIPAIFESIGSVIEKVGGVIIGIIEAVGGAVAGVVTSIAEGIATVVNAVKGDAKAEAEAQIAVLEAQTLSIQKLSTIDPGTMTATALGIEAIKESLSDLGSPSLLGSLGKMMGGDGPISEILELAKNSGGITAAATAISTFVKNAALFKEGFKMDDSVTENIKKVVDALGSGDKAGLTSIERVIKAINELDTDKISAISAMTIPKIPDMMPSSAESYERVFAALKKTQPSLLENAGNAIFAAAKGMFSPEEPKQNDGGASGKSNPKMGGMPAAANDIKKASEKGPGVKLFGKTYFTKEEINNATHANGKPVKSSMKSSARRKLDLLQNKSQIGSRRNETFVGGKMVSSNPPMVDASANMQNGRAAAIGQGATRASSTSSGGSPTIVAPSTTNISSPTNNSSSYSTPMSNLPVSPAAQILRNSINF